MNICIFGDSITWGANDYEGVLPLDDLPDGLHPDSGGHRKMFEKIKSELDSRVPHLRGDGNDRE